jgi:hypothetical protein
MKTKIKKLVVLDVGMKNINKKDRTKRSTEYGIYAALQNHIGYLRR